jgi:ATP-dependent Clp protease ATP-binding subunit ClpC
MTEENYNFTLDAKAAFDTADSYAAFHGHKVICTEHLLVGLLSHPNIATNVLRKMKISRFHLLDKAKTLFGKVEEYQHATIVRSPRTRKVLALATKVARIMDPSSTATNPPQISSHHLLLGILREDESLAAQLLKKRGITYDKYLAAVEKNIKMPTAPQTEAPLPLEQILASINALQVPDVALLSIFVNDMKPEQRKKLGQWAAKVSYVVSMAEE